VFHISIWGQISPWRLDCTARFRCRSPEDFGTDFSEKEPQIDGGIVYAY